MHVQPTSLEVFKLLDHFHDLSTTDRNTKHQGSHLFDHLTDAKISAHHGVTCFPGGTRVLTLSDMSHHRDRCCVPLVTGYHLVSSSLALFDSPRDHTLF